MGARVMTDKQIRRAILRCQTGIHMQELILDGESFKLDFTGSWQLYRLVNYVPAEMWEFDAMPVPQELRNLMRLIIDDERTREVVDG